MSVSVLGKSVATSSSVGSVSIYDTETMKETDWLPCHDDAECWIVTLGQNKQMFTGGDDSYFRLWVRTNKKCSTNLLTYCARFLISRDKFPSN